MAGRLLAIAADEGVGAVFFGGPAGVTERAAARWRQRLPALRLDVVGAGSAIGLDGETVDGGAELLDGLRSIDPAVVLVGLGAPKQERWIDRHAGALPGTKVLMGVGGAFDIWAGDLPRAPRWLRGAGLEWAWRLALQPRRLPRIFRATVVFLVRAATDGA